MVDDEDEDDNAEPIIELPESPSPPEDDQDEEASDNNKHKEQRHEESSRRVEQHSPDANNSIHQPRSTNPLGVQPRKPIRTHQSSPLATMARPGHSKKRFE